MPYDNSGSGPLRVPGIGMQLDAGLDEDSLHQDAKHGSYFAEGIEGWSGPRLTARELSMLRLMESVTDKPDWEKKVFDNAIADKWRAEAMALPLISEATWDWVLEELRDKATEFATSGKVLALDSHARLAKSTPGANVRAELIANVAPLLSLPEEKRDWHPGSGNQVLNLVHPSLYPLVYGRTRVLTQGDRVDLPEMLASCGQGEVAVRTEHELGRAWSTRFQWLPCEVEFTGKDDDTVRITSYINNLHPAKHQALYHTIEKVIGLSVPLWNDVLMYEAGRTPPRILTFGAEWTPQLPDWAANLPRKTTDESFAETMQKVKEYLALPDRAGYIPGDDEEEDDEDDDSDEDGPDGDDTGGLWDPERVFISLERKLARIETNESARQWEFSSEIQEVLERKWKRIRHVAHPEPGAAFTYEEWKKGVQRPIIPASGFSGGTEHNFDFWPQKLSLRKWFGEKGLQVVVKLASIELTPEKPQYPGGSWHVEGMKNEHIVATSIYYYDSENITSSALVLRQGAFLDEMELVYEQDDHEPLSTVFGTESMRDEKAVQVIGKVTTPKGRLLAFPNTLQHKVEPFELVDKTKPGHRRFLVLWLVDPHFRICSTRNVPPQQHSWWAEAALDAVDFGPLPQELIDMVKGEVGEWPMGLEEAKALRLDLMAERTRASELVETAFEWYNLCEH
ncbi:hypothetical protein GE09DRAFT_220286 [Coniochaeta sp. 2T2.1]|nr:hypothetical protein GE09DRAFT_220286 [Coniochaeta sp. 2T2.1]